MANEKKANNSQTETNLNTEENSKQKDLTEINVAESKERKWKRQAKEARGGGY